MLRTFAPELALSDMFHVTLVRPDDYPAAEGLRPLAQALAFALRRSGVPVAVSDNTVVHDAVNVMVGAHLLDAAVADTLPSSTIVFNSEPLAAEAAHYAALVPFVRKFEVWDYHPRNLAALRALGNASARLVEAGYVPEFERVVHLPAKDVDVLFYGQMSPHRRAVLGALERWGMRVVWLHGVYGAERDAWIGRAKLVLNVHYRPGALFESGRIVYLLSNRCVVLTEAEAPDDVAADLEPGLAAARAEALPALAAALLADVPRCAALSARGYQSVRRRDFGANVARALAQRHRI